MRRFYRYYMNNIYDIAARSAVVSMGATTSAFAFSSAYHDRPFAMDPMLVLVAGWVGGTTILMAPVAIPIAAVSYGAYHIGKKTKDLAKKKECLTVFSSSFFFSL